MKKLSPSRKRLASQTIVHILTGSVAAYKAGDLIQQMRDEGAQVVCVLTDSAKQFVTPLVLRALSGQKVYHDFFSPETPYDVVHTTLAEQADAILIAPASADFIARLAAGMANDLASCIVLAASCPVILAPAMNDQMLRHPITQQNIQKLQTIGYRFIDSVKGYLVCGKEAVGHIADEATILGVLAKTLSSSSRKS